MSSSKDFKDFILYQLKDLKITYRQMMGEFLLYYNERLFGGIYDDRLLIKITDSNKKYSLEKAIPYENAKPMFFVDNLDDTEYLVNLIKDTCKDLQQKKT